jgi:hypothetical protein
MITSRCFSSMASAMNRWKLLELYLHLQSADSTNFFFFFRMLLVWYKREFDWGDVLRLWETLWTDYFSSSTRSIVFESSLTEIAMLVI